MSSNTFGQRLKALREARGISLRALSDELANQGHSITHSGIQKWEKDEGASLPRRAVLAALCKYFNVSPSWFMENLYTEASPKKPKMRELTDLDLLSQEEFDILLAVKDQFLKSRALGKVSNDIG